MRKLIYSINITLDGCCDHTKGMAGEDVHAYFADLLREVDVFVYGRKTYELMVPFWPDVAKNHTGPADSMSEFAEAFVSVKKTIVFSRTLEKADDPKTNIINTDLREAILKLKEEEGGDMLLGGVDLPSQLMELDLIDEYRIMVQPLIVGEGRRLFDSVSLPEKLSLKLAESKTLKSGCIALHYVR
ncbi:MAG: dihydrofolate reductase [Terrimonas ferruginea]|uniref:dihydrofolate reductase family protein n=1 Tax=Terrimonas ferruginea TaxID=249 RepID=UPI000929444F|nr:dihydrofolate reductase family protein [Terrimonas ferruginea]MBN8784693.1 dihydrofolate reductase [Terrimonas ferruginea]OJW45525.1 MAG: dihydrofolate reductase [Sphingobacteriales bacterium 48-107]